MTGGGGGVVIIRPLLDSGRLTPKEQKQVCEIQERLSGGIVADKKDRDLLGRICAAVSGRA